MAKAKARRTFQQNVSIKAAQVKASVKKKYAEFKVYGSAYAKDLKKAYQVGYSRGWDDSKKIPKRLGAKTAATYGYGRGISEYRRMH